MVNLEFLINGVLVTPRSVNHALLAAEKGPTLGYIWVVLYVTKKKVSSSLVLKLLFLK